MVYAPERTETQPVQPGAAGRPPAKTRGGIVPASITRASVEGYRCGTCGSEEIQRLSVVYEGGTSTINARTSGTSTGFGLARGGLGVGTSFNSSRTRGTQMSELAKRAAPPKGKSTGGWVVAGIAGGLALMLFGGPVVGVLVLIGCGFGAFRAAQYNREMLPGQIAEWNECWLCHRCGNISRIQP